MKIIIIKSKSIEFKCFVDDEDFKNLNSFKWNFNLKTGATRSSKRKTIYMHRYIIDCPTGFSVDHIDGNNLNNQKVNLRICKNKENVRNRPRKNKNNTSGFKGVYYESWGNLKKRWAAQIKFEYKHIKLGRFFTAEEAAKAYDKAAIKYFGEFANLNFKEETNDCPILEHGFEHEAN